MKKLSLMMVAAAALLFSVQTAEAQVTQNDEAPQEVKMTAQEDWTAVETTQLPLEVQAAVERDFAGATILEAYVKDKEGTQTYKLKITTADGQAKKLYSDPQGNWIQKDDKKKE